MRTNKVTKIIRKHGRNLRNFESRNLAYTELLAFLSTKHCLLAPKFFFTQKHVNFPGQTARKSVLNK